MKYRTAKCLTMISPAVILFVLAFYYSSVQAMPSDMAVFHMFMGLMIGFICGVLLWGFGRILYCNNYIDRCKYTPGKLTSVWEFSSRVNLSKQMTAEELKNEVTSYFDRSYHSMALDDDELLDFCRAAILLRYIALWESYTNIKNKEIIQLIKKHESAMKVLDFYKGA